MLLTPDLMPLRVRRVHRLRHTWVQSSLGQGQFLEWDTRISLFTQSWGGSPEATIGYFDIDDVDMRFLRDAHTASGAGGAATDGVYYETTFSTVADGITYGPTGAIEPNRVNATTAVIRHHDGRKHIFEIIRTDANPASDGREGRLIRIEDRNGNATVITYQFAANATDATLGNDRSQLWKMATVTDPYGQRATISYHSAPIASRWCVSRIDLPGGQALTYAYTPVSVGSANLLSLVIGHPDGSQSSFVPSIDAARQQIAVTIIDPWAEGGPESQRKVAYFNQSSFTNPDGTVTPLPFGVVRRVVKNGEVVYRSWQDPATPTTLYVYEGGRKLIRLVTLGYRTHASVSYATNFVYDDAVDQPNWSALTWEVINTGSDFANWSLPNKETDALARTTNYAYHPTNRKPTRITHPDGSTETFTYNAFQQVLRHVDRLGRITDHAYDAKGNLLSRTVAVGTPAQATWSWTYNAKGQRLSASDANGNVTTFAYDSRGYPASMTEPGDRADDPAVTWSVVHGPTGQRVSETNPESGVVTYGYNLANRPTTTGFADGSTEVVTWGTGATAGLIVERKDRNGNRTTYAYDGMGRPTTTVTAAGTAVAVSEVCAYLYGTDHKTSCTKAGETTSWTYDYRNRQVTETRRPKVGISLTEHTAYGSAGRIISTTDAYGRRTFPVYDTNDRVIRTVRELVPGGVASPAGVASLARSLAANPEYVIDETTYDAEGQVTARVDGRGIRSTIAYDAQGRVTSRIEAEAVWNGSAWVPQTIAARTDYVYDAQGNLRQTILPRSFARAADGTWLAGSDGSFRTTRTYTRRNLVATEVAADGLNQANQPRAERAVTAFAYTGTRKVKRVTDPRGFITTNSYSLCCDRLIEVQDPSGAYTRFQYDSYGNRTAMTDGNGNVTATTYDARHRPVTMTNGAGEVTRYAYDDNLTDGNGLDAAGSPLVAHLAGLGLGAGSDGSAARVTNPAGEISYQIHDGLGRPVRSVDGLLHPTTITYDTMVGGLVETAQRDPLGHVTKVRADGAGRVRQQVDALGYIASAAYDANGNRVSATDANGVGMSCVFDARNREVSCTTTRSDVTTTTSRTFDAHNNVRTEVDALGKITTHVYDARDRKVTTTDRIAASTQFRYDAVGNLTRIIDAEGNELVPGFGITDYSYDGRNLLIREEFPTGSKGRTVRTYTYDEGRRLTSRTVTTNPASSFSEVTTYAYDGANRLRTRGYADGKNDTFTYDLASRLKTAVSARYATIVARSYDAAGRLISEQQTVPEGQVVGTTASPLTATIGYTYDAADRNTQVTYPDGRVVTRAFTDRNQLAAVGFAGASVATRSYDNGGRLTSTTYGNGVVESRTYVPGDQRVKTIVAPGVTSFTYTYDANGRKLSETDGIIAANSQTFSYDNQDRLTAWSKATGVTPAQTQTWNLTPVGDWASTVKDGVTETRTHNRVHELTAIGRASLTYDAKGNLTQDEQVQHYTWDPENRLATARIPWSATTFGAMATYTYDALGRRLGKTVNGRSTRFLHDGARVVLETELAAIPSQASINGSEADGTLPNANQLPANGGIINGGGVTRINFQPETTVIPAGYLADKGKTYGVRTNGKAYGWTVAQTGRQQVRNYQVPPELDTAALMKPTAGDTAGVWEIALANGTYPVVVVCGDPLSTQQTNNITIEGIAFTDPDPATSPSYTQGDFDGYAATVTVTDGKLTIASGVGAVNPKLCFIEIGSASGAIDSAAQARLADFVVKATDRTYAPQQAFANRSYVYGSYVDEVVAFVDGVARAYVHSNHLYSPAAVTNSTGAVVERYRYDAYGKQAIADANGKVFPVSAYGFQRGLTGYEIDRETGLHFARARMFSPNLGRFISRDPAGYIEGLNVYTAYFIPNKVDPLGRYSCEVEGTSAYYDSGLLYRSWRQNFNPMLDYGYAQAQYAIRRNGLSVEISASAYAKVVDTGFFSGDTYGGNTVSSNGGATCKLEGTKCVWRSDGLPQGARDQSELTTADIAASMSGMGTDTLIVNVTVLAFAIRPGESISVDVSGGGYGVSVGFSIGDLISGEVYSPKILYAYNSKAKEFKCKCVD